MSHCFLFFQEKEAKTDQKQHSIVFSIEHSSPNHTCQQLFRLLTVLCLTSESATQFQKIVDAYFKSETEKILKQGKPNNLM